MAAEVLDILMRLAAAGFLGACIGFERRVHHKAIGIAGLVGKWPSAMTTRLPIMYGSREFAEAGGLISYGVFRELRASFATQR